MLIAPTRFSGTIAELGPNVDTSKYAVGKNVAVYVPHLSPFVCMSCPVLNSRQRADHWVQHAWLRMRFNPHPKPVPSVRSHRMSNLPGILFSRLQHIHRVFLVVAVASPSTS